MTIPPLLLLLAAVAATWFLVGLIWFVQVVHYPLMAKAVGVPSFEAYEATHRTLTTLVVGPVMCFELAVTAAMLVEPLFPVQTMTERWVVYGAFVALLGIWAATAFLSVPCHHLLSQGWNPEAHAFLVRSNWVRTLLWTGRGVALLWLVWRRVA